MRKAEKAGQEVHLIKKSDHTNKQNQMEARKMAQLINEEEDRKRNLTPIQLPPCRRT